MRNSSDNIEEFVILSGYSDEFEVYGELKCEVIWFDNTKNSTDTNIKTSKRYITHTHVKFGPKDCEDSDMYEIWIIYYLGQN